MGAIVGVLRYPLNLGRMTVDAAQGRVPEFTLGWRIRLSRETAGMDQVTLAERTGIARNTIGNYELDITSNPKVLPNRGGIQHGHAHRRMARVAASGGPRG